AIHFDAYRVIQNINISPLLYKLAQQIGFFPEKGTLKATISAMWVLDVSKLTLRFPAALRFFNNPATSFLQSDVLAYTALDTYYPLLLFLAFSHYGFVPDIYNAPPLFPHNSLDTAKMDHLTETNGAQWLLKCQSIDAYDTPEASHHSESARKEEEKAERGMEQIARCIR
uniref:Uncharacterized protein n=1 Tax=Romanomermis culicivorax TaxID=13658 RepID=A0A915IKJ4_ROMCU